MRAEEKGTISYGVENSEVLLPSSHCVRFLRFASVHRLSCIYQRQP